MTTSNKFFSTAALCSILFLTACGNVPQSQTTTPTSPKTDTIENEVLVETNISELETQESETVEADDSIEMMPEDMALGVNVRTQTEVTSLSAKFEYNNDPQFLNCGYESLLSCQNQTANQMALAKKDADVCDSIMDNAQALNCKNQLWNQLASLEKDATLCENLSDDFALNSCKNQVSFSVAVTNGDASKCESISDFYQIDECKNQATIAKAVADSDLAVCESIVMYEYETIFAEPETITDGEITAPINIEPEIIKTPVADENIFYKQDCINQVQMQQEMAAQEAEMEAQQADFQAEMEAQAEADAENQAQTEAAQIAAESAFQDESENPELGQEEIPNEDTPTGLIEDTVSE